MKIRILRGTTIGDPPVFTPGEGDPPTFAPGDIVEVDRALAQQLIGNNKAEYVSGDDLIEKAPYEEEAVSEVKKEAATKRKAKSKRRKAAADKKAEATEEAEEEETEEETEEPFVVETATTEAPEDATFPRYGRGRG